MSSADVAQRCALLASRLAHETGLSHVQRLDLLTELAAGAAVQLSATVDAARRAGVSWAEIGASTGLSKQGAQQRWSPRPVRSTSIHPDEQPLI